MIQRLFKKIESTHTYLSLNVQRYCNASSIYSFFFLRWRMNFSNAQSIKKQIKSSVKSFVYTIAIFQINRNKYTELKKFHNSFFFCAKFSFWKVFIVNRRFFESWDYKLMLQKQFFNYGIFIFQQSAVFLYSMVL